MKHSIEPSLLALLIQAFAFTLYIPYMEMDTLDIEFHEICPQWNYTISPRSISKPS
jgi:hypothetical protein